MLRQRIMENDGHGRDTIRERKDGRTDGRRNAPPSHARARQRQGQHALEGIIAGFRGTVIAIMYLNQMSSDLPIRMVSIPQDRPHKKLYQSDPYVSYRHRQMRAWHFWGRYLAWWVSR